MQREAALSQRLEGLVTLPIHHIDINDLDDADKSVCVIIRLLSFAEREAMALGLEDTRATLRDASESFLTELISMHPQSAKKLLERAAASIGN